MATHPDLTRLRTMPSAPAARHPVYYMVHIAHERDAQHGPKPRPAQPDNQIGPYGDDPAQFGELYMHVWAAHDGCVSNAPPLTKEQLCLGDLPRFREDWISALAEGTPLDDEAGNEDSAFVFDKKYCVHWTDAAAHPWQGSVMQLDHSFDPWDAERLLEAWLRAALIAGVAPQKRPGKTQPEHQPDWDDPWWDA